MLWQCHRKLELYFVREQDYQNSPHADRPGDANVRAEDALEMIVEQLSQLGGGRDFQGNRVGSHNADVWIPDLAWRYWQPRLPPGRLMDDVSHLTHDHIIPFYDAAWDLCRIGVLRPGVFAPIGQEIAAAFGDQFVITEFGREWLQDARHRPVLAPTRLGQMLQALGGRFGAGYAQRVTEAVNTYRAQNYLSTCTMAGAAAESVLLATAVAKRKDETGVLQTSSGRSGRLEVTRLVTANLSASVGDQFKAALNVLHYWRDDAAHGTATTISEIEAHAALTQLLRLAQFTSDHWDLLTTT
jgi:hypothetical protein